MQTHCASQSFLLPRGACCGSAAHPPPSGISSSSDFNPLGRALPLPQCPCPPFSHLCSLLHPFPPPPFPLVSPLPLQHRSGHWRRSRGRRGAHGGEGAGWVGREPGGCGLAGTLQLAAGDLVPPASRSDGGEEILLDTHARATCWARLGEAAASSSAPGTGRRP